MYTISVLLGKESVKAVLFASDFNKIKEYNAECSKETAVEVAADLAKKLRLNHGIPAVQIKCVGVAVECGVGCPCCIAEEIEKVAEVKTAAASVVKAKALGEAYLEKKNSLIYLKIDEKVESGIVIDKALYTGFDGKGGNVAHMVIDCGGFECTCGRKGCFEAYVTNSGIKKIAAQNNIVGSDNLTVKSLYAMDGEAVDAAKKFYIEHLASGITDIINLFQPEELVLEGEFTEVGDAIMNPMMEIVLKDQYTRHSDNKTNVRFAKHGECATLIGATMLVK